jgi:hypothetical protein
MVNDCSSCMYSPGNLYEGTGEFVATFLRGKVQTATDFPVEHTFGECWLPVEDGELAAVRRGGILVRTNGGETVSTETVAARRHAGTHLPVIWWNNTTGNSQLALAA